MPLITHMTDMMAEGWICYPETMRTTVQIRKLTPSLLWTGLWAYVPHSPFLPSSSSFFSLSPFLTLFLIGVRTLNARSALSLFTAHNIVFLTTDTMFYRTLCSSLELTCLWTTISPLSLHLNMELPGQAAILFPRTMRIKITKPRWWIRNWKLILDLWRCYHEVPLAPNPPPWHLILCDLNTRSIVDISINCALCNLHLNVAPTAFSDVESFKRGGSWLHRFPSNTK